MGVCSYKLYDIFLEFSELSFFIISDAMDCPAVQ